MKVLLIAILICVAFTPAIHPQNLPILEQLQSEIIQIIQHARYSVVTVSAKTSHSVIVNTKESGLFSLFKDNREEKKKDVWVVGSGIIYNDEGFIVTSSNILADFKMIKVSLCDGTEFEADYIGTDQSTGLAILKIDEKKLEPTRIGNSDDVMLYSLVMALGNSMGISPFASFGLVNGFTRDGKIILSTPINPGNIGGAVFNLRGEIVGIITAQVNSDASMMGPSYLNYSHQNGLALPINQVVSRVDRIIRWHHQKLNWLGISLDPDSQVDNKLVVDSVYINSPAARVGLRKGDRLIKYNETNLYRPEVLGDLIEQTRPGTSVSINFIRHNTTLKVFPRIEKVWPTGFNPNKPRHLTPKLMNENFRTPIQSPVLITPEKFQQINTRMIEMENQIKSLKSQVKK